MDIQLNEIKSDDLELIRNWRNSENVSKYMYTEEEITIENQKLWFEKISNDNKSIYKLIIYNGKKIGLASITDISNVFDGCYWAFYLGDTSIRGAGIGSKVEHKIIEFVFNELKLNKLKCEVFAFNDKVISMHEKFGFRRESYFRNHVRKNNSYYDVVGLALFKRDWELIRNTFKDKIFRR